MRLLGQLIGSYAAAQAQEQQARAAAKRWQETGDLYVDPQGRRFKCGPWVWHVYGERVTWIS